MKFKNQITQKELKKHIDYNPETGVFLRKTSIHGNPIKPVVTGYIAHGYRLITVGCIKYRSHRLAWLYMTGEWPNRIDHINRVRSDNRWENLRSVTSLENQRNLPKMKSNTSGVTGIHWDKSRCKWKADITLHNKTKYLGRFDDKFEAICARKSAERRYGFHYNHGI